ncbi:hypothetical protein FKP32DRAFT_1211133 [Trametes sanguinea]|nr:hypothetical protein FKP32DRAFT_1211133 [Trametes sanguinea]
MAGSFVQTYGRFLHRLRELYPTRSQPILVFTSVRLRSCLTTYPTRLLWARVRRLLSDNRRHTAGDHNIFLPDTIGLDAWEDVFSDNQHANISDSQYITRLRRCLRTGWFDGGFGQGRDGPPQLLDTARPLQKRKVILLVVAGCRGQ